MPADYYEALGGVGREQRRHREGVPPPRSRAASRRQPRLARSRGEVQGGRGSRTKCSRIRSGASATTGSVPKASVPPPATRNFGGLGDLFDAFFGGGFGGGSRGPSGPPRGSDLEVVVDLDLEEAVFGAEAPISVRTAVTCDVCDGSGAAEGTRPVTCYECNGSGQVRRVRQSILGQMVTAGPCRAAAASARSSPRLRALPGRRAADRGAHVPGRCPGRRRQRIDTALDRARCSGPEARRGWRPLRPRAGSRARPLHARWPRPGVRPSDRVHASGARSTSDDRHARRHRRPRAPAGTQTGRVFKLRGRGVPHPGGRSRGDVLVRVSVETPTRLTHEEEDLLRQLAEERGEDVAPAETGLFSKIRSAFK